MAWPSDDTHIVVLCLKSKDLKCNKLWILTDPLINHHVTTGFTDMDELREPQTLSSHPANPDSLAHNDQNMNSQCVLKCLNPL